jgi:hypothetical protein
MPKEGDMETEVWQQLMDRVVAAAPGGYLAPGAGTTGGDPLGLKYANLGPVALVLNEGVDATVDAGADRDELLNSVADDAGDDISRDDVDAALSGDERCPDPALIQSFASWLAIDAEGIMDAAVKGGCKNYGAATPPPGY